jgi:hypothetical protein
MWREKELPREEEIPELGMAERKRVKVALSRINVIMRTKLEYQVECSDQDFQSSPTIREELAFGDLYITDVTDKSAKSYIDSRTKKYGIALATVKREISFLSGFFGIWLPLNVGPGLIVGENPFNTPSVRKMLGGK